MARLFSKGSNPKILSKLEDLFAGFDCIHEKSSYDQLHADFCDWFTKNIEVAEKKAKKSGRVIVAAHGSSYGQAAKVLDIAAKVFVYYCNMPSPEVAQMFVPMLHGALDNQIIGHLIGRFPEAGISSNSLEDVDRAKYEQLQSLVAREITDDFHSKIYPVQYDDITFRRLNRPVATGAA